MTPKIQYKFKHRFIGRNEKLKNKATEIMFLKREQDGPIKPKINDNKRSKRLNLNNLSQSQAASMEHRERLSLA